jgi:hypothetical protein
MEAYQQLENQLFDVTVRLSAKFKERNPEFLAGKLLYRTAYYTARFP